MSTSSLAAIVKAALERLQESFSFVYTSLKERAVVALLFLSESKKALCSSLLVTAYKCYWLFVEGHVPENKDLAIKALQNENFSLIFALHKRGVDFNESQYRNAIENFAFDLGGDLSLIESALAFIDLLGDEVKFSVQRNILFSLHSQSLDTCTAVLKALKTHGWDLNIQDAQGKTAAHYAAERGLELFLFLKELGADMALKDAQGKTPGQILALSRFFVDDIEALRRDGTALAHEFAKEGRVDDLQAIAAVGANLDIRDRSGCRPLHYAAEYGKKEVLEVLVSLGADVNAKDASGRSPVFTAVRQKDIETIEFLATLGADLNVEDYDGCSLANFAFSYCNVELTKKLHELGVRFTSGKRGSLYRCCSLLLHERLGSIPAFFQALYEIDPDFFCKLQDERGRTIAHRFTFNTFCSLWREAALPWEKCPLFVQDAKGNTPLHKLASQEELVPWLAFLDLKWLEIRNNEGMTPLDVFSYSLSLEWLRKQKVQTGEMIVDKAHFTQKAQELEVAFERLWSRLIFGEEEGQIPFEVFRIELSQRGVTIIFPDTVKAALDKMIENIKNQEAMVGAPREENVAETFSYYSFMLLHLEKIVYKLQEEPDTRDVARTLLMTALPQLEGRCATAYMEEIQQVAKAVAGESCDLEVSSLLEKSASNALEKTVEASVGDLGHSNVHVLAALKHYFGFSPIADPLAAGYQRFIDVCQADIEKKWSTPSAIDYLEGAFKTVSIDLLSLLLRDCSTGVDSRYLALYEEALAKELQIQESAKERLLQTGLSQEMTETFLQFFTSVEGASLAIASRKWPTLLTKQTIAQCFLELIQEKFSEVQTLSREEVEEAFAVAEIDSEESLSDVFTSIRRKIGLKGVHQISLWGRETRGFLQSMINWQQLQEKILKRGADTSSIGAVLEVKQAYDQEMWDLSNSLMEESSIELSINLKAYGLASVAILQESRLAFELLHTKEEAIFSLVDGEETGSKRVLNQRGVCLLAERLQILSRAVL